MESPVNKISPRALGGIFFISLVVLAGLGFYFWVGLVDHAQLSIFIPILAVVAILAVGLVLRWPRMGLFLILLTVPVEVGLVYIAGFGVYVVQPLIMLTALAVLLRYDLIRGKVTFPIELLPVVALWIVYIFSGLIAINNRVTWGGIIFFIPLICMCWLVARLARQLDFLKLLVALSIWVGVAIAFLGIIQVVAYHLGINLAIDSYQRAFLVAYGRPSGLEGEPNWFGIYTGMVLAIAFPFWVRRQRLGKLPINTGVIILLVLAVLLSGTRSIWVGLLVELIVVNLINVRLWGKKLRRFLPFVVLMIAVLALLLLLNPKLVEPLARVRATFDASEFNSALRVHTWQMALENIFQRPWTGYGLNSWQILSLKYPDVNSMPAVIGGKSVPNIFLDNWLAAGILGALAIIYLIVFYSLRLIRLVRYRKDRLASTFGEAMLGGWIAIIVASIFTNAFIHIFFWQMVALIIATLGYYRRSLNPVKPSESVS